MGVMSTDNLKKVILVLAKLGNVAGKAFEDKKLSMADLAYLPEFVMLFPDLIAIDWTKIVPEAKELDSSEIQEIIALFNGAFDIPEDKIETSIEAVLAIASQLIALIANLLAIFKKPA